MDLFITRTHAKIYRQVPRSRNLSTCVYDYIEAAREASRPPCGGAPRKKGSASGERPGCCERKRKTWVTHPGPPKNRPRDKRRVQGAPEPKHRGAPCHRTGERPATAQGSALAAAQGSAPATAREPPANRPRDTRTIQGAPERLHRGAPCHCTGARPGRRTGERPGYRTEPPANRPRDKRRIQGAPEHLHRGAPCHCTGARPGRCTGERPGYRTGIAPAPTKRRPAPPSTTPVDASARGRPLTDAARC